MIEYCVGDGRKEMGVRKTYQIILPRNMKETALKAHHNHTTASIVITGQG